MKHKFCKEYQAVYDAFTEKPSDEDAIWWDNWVKGVIKDGSWDRLNYIYDYGDPQNEHDALIDWKKP